MKLNVFACVRQPSQGPTFGIKGELWNNPRSLRGCWEIQYKSDVWPCASVFRLQVVQQEVDTLKSFLWKRYYTAVSSLKLRCLSENSKASSHLIDVSVHFSLTSISPVTFTPSLPPTTWWLQPSTPACSMSPHNLTRWELDFISGRYRNRLFARERSGFRIVTFSRYASTGSV